MAIEKLANQADTYWRGDVVALAGELAKGTARDVVWCEEAIEDCTPNERAWCEAEGAARGLLKLSRMDGLDSAYRWQLVEMLKAAREKARVAARRLAAEWSTAVEVVL